MTIEKAVGEELRYCRTQKGLSQEELGFEASLHRTYIILIKSLIMKLELEERGNIHMDEVWFVIVDSQAPPSDDFDTIATMEGLYENQYKLGRLFIAAPDLLIACKKQQHALEKLLAICSPKTASAYFPSRLIKNARTYAKKAIAKATVEI